MMYDGIGLHGKFLLALTVLGFGFIVLQRAKVETGALKKVGNIIAAIIVAGSLLAVICITKLSLCKMSKSSCPVGSKTQMMPGMPFEHPPITK